MDKAIQLLTEFASKGPHRAKFYWGEEEAHVLMGPPLVDQQLDLPEVVMALLRVSDSTLIFARRPSLTDPAETLLHLYSARLIGLIGFDDPELGIQIGDSYGGDYVFYFKEGRITALASSGRTRVLDEDLQGLILRTLEARGTYWHE